MIKKAFLFVLTGAAFATMTSCDDDDDGTSGTTTPQSSEIAEALLSDDWTVESLIDDGEDETADFTEFVLTFNAEGQVTANHGTNSDLSRNGTYNVYTDDDQVELEMNFPNPGVLDDLNDDWYFVSQSATSLTWDDEGDVLVLTRQ